MNAVAKAEPAVVSIIITKDVATVEQYYQQYNPFSNLFGNDDSNSSNNNTEQQEVGGGSGFFVSSDGYIVTNNHVVSDSSADYTVMTSDGTKYAAKILDTDPTMDVAIIKIEGKNFPYLKFADSSTLKLGQTAIAIGNALAEFQNSISMGIISGLSRSITASDNSGNSEQLDGVIQTDAAINSGNSGGPLLDIEGNVIGVNVAVENSANSIGFALPSNIVKSIAESVKDSGEIVKPYLGVRYTLVTDRIKKTNNLSVDYGALVIKGSSADELAVIPGSPANKAGIVENDIILEIDGVKINSDHSITSVIRQKSIGQTVTIKLQHGGKTKEVKVKLEKAPSNL
jgi:serine protease Do